MTLTHFRCMRTTEFVSKSETHYHVDSQLCLADVSFCEVSEDEIGMRIYLKRSKTDPTGKVASVLIGCTGTTICSPCAMRTYMYLTRSSGSLNQPLFS